jgi:ATP-dependent DNA helicase RecG
MNPVSPIIFHIPHASRKAPQDIRQSTECGSEMGDYFRFELVQSPLKRSEKLPEKLPEKLSDLQKAIVLQMRSDPKVTYGQLAKTTKKSREAIRKNIRRLKELGIIKRVGPDKGGYWQVTLTEK